MFQTKGLILGTAATLAMSAAAQAADLPVKAKVVEYVKVCSLYGAGFWYIPGTDTCIKIGGYLRVDANYNAGVYDAPYWFGDSAVNASGSYDNRYVNKINSRSRMALTVDTRTATEYGVVRTFGQSDWQFSSYGATSGINPSTIAGYSGAGQQNNDTVGNGYVATEFLFLQFAGFTFGKSQSAYAVPWNGYLGNNNTSFLIGGPDYVTGVNNIQYTQQFGNGISATIGLDEGLVFNRAGIYNLSTPSLVNAVGAGSYSAYGGQVVPDIAGNIRVEQAWGTFQISGIAHLVNATYNTLGAPITTIAGLPATNASLTSGNPSDKWGGAVTAGLQLKNLPTGPGDTFTIDGTVSKGDTKPVISTSFGTPSFVMFGSSSNAFRSLAIGVNSDAVYGIDTGGVLQLTSAYGMRAAFIHNWSPQWQSSIYGTYGAVRYNATASTAYCNAYNTSNPGAKSADYSCNPNYNISQIGFRTGYTPVANLTFSGEVLWTHLDTMFSGTAVLTPSAPLPAATYQYRDQNTFGVNVRAQRNF